MPFQSSWVEHWLERYCAPGAHEFSHFKSDVLKCDLCGKEELIGGATCIVCGLPGATPLTLLHEREEAPTGVVAQFKGKLCGPCLDEFRERRVIRGWYVEAVG